MDSVFQAVLSLDLNKWKILIWATDEIYGNIKKSINKDYIDIENCSKFNVEIFGTYIRPPPLPDLLLIVTGNMDENRDFIFLNFWFTSKLQNNNLWKNMSKIEMYWSQVNLQNFKSFHPIQLEQEQQKKKHNLRPNHTNPCSMNSNQYFKSFHKLQFK